MSEFGQATPCPPWCVNTDCDGTSHVSTRARVTEGALFQVLEPDPVTGVLTRSVRSDGEIALRAADLASVQEMISYLLPA